jgi:hypothetical protein
VEGYKEETDKIRNGNRRLKTEKDKEKERGEKMKREVWT